MLLVLYILRVVYICDKKIKLNQKWEEDYLEWHVRGSGCKADEGQRTIYNWFKPVEIKQAEQIKEIEEEEEYDSDVYDNMDEDDLIQVDEIDDDQDQEFLTIDIEETSNNSSNIKRRIICTGLRSAEISKYIKRTPAQFGGSRRIEIVASELFPKLFSQKFSRKKLNPTQKRKLNRALFAESIWHIDRASM